MRLSLQCSVLLASAMAFASGSKTIEGRIEAVPKDDGLWTLRIGTEAVPVVAAKRIRFWVKKAPAEAASFHVGDAVVARIDPEKTPAVLRELADEESWTWLEGVRKGVVQGVVRDFDGKRLTMVLADGSAVVYRVSEKTRLVIGGKPATPGSLKAGQRLWLKGRTLPSLDLWLVDASDRALAATARKTATKKAGVKGAVETTVLSKTGTIEGEAAALHADAKMFDLLMGDVLLHVSYTATTTFLYAGAKCGPAEIVRGRKVAVVYRRDEYGRIGASKVEIR